MVVLTLTLRPYLFGPRWIVRRRLDKSQRRSDQARHLILLAFGAIFDDQGEFISRLISSSKRDPQFLVRSIHLKLEGPAIAQVYCGNRHVCRIKLDAFQIREQRPENHSFDPDQLLMFPIEPKVQSNMQRVEVMIGNVLRWREGPRLLRGLKQSLKLHCGSAKRSLRKHHK